MDTVVGGIRRRRRKKFPATNIESLPDEVLVEILVRLSADEICENARLVCRNWCHLIHSDAFVNTHRSNSNWGLLLSNASYTKQPLFLAEREGRIEMESQKLPPTLYLKKHLPIPASCNGLVLCIESSDLYTASIVNLATKQAFSLPPAEVYSYYFGIAYAAASMEYKVVRAYAPNSTQIFCHILTAGVDNEWRRVGVDTLSCGAKMLLLKTPLITQGFMHWTWKRQGTRVLTLNVETEVFTESFVPLHPHPVDDDGWVGSCMQYLSTGRHLSLLVTRGKWLWEVWEMEGESGEWRKLLPNIDLEAHKCIEEHGFFVPLGWIKYPVLLALYHIWGRTCIVYNRNTDEIHSIELPQPCRKYKAIAHRNTLEWVNQQHWKLVMGPAVRRQPPPHPHRGSESSLKVVEVIRRRPYYSRRCKKVPASNIESLPNEVLSEILARVSADEIWEKARFVCRNWCRIIHSDGFVSVHRHHHRDSYRLVLNNALHGSVQLFVANGGRVEISKLYHKKNYFPLPVSSNGLILWIDGSYDFTININNFVTEQTFRVPRWIPHGLDNLCRFGIGYAAASMVYKVVRTYKLRFKQVSTEFGILTVGVDSKWRRCGSADNLSRAAKKILFGDPLITPGFMHWTDQWGGRVLTLNVETEMFTGSWIPLHLREDDRGHGPRRRRMYFLSTGRHVSLFFRRGDWMFEVWEMEGESREWRKLLPNVDLEVHKLRIERDFGYDECGTLVPIGWVKYPVVVGMCFWGGEGRTCVVYNLDTDEIESVELPQPCLSYRTVVHRNTLEWVR